MNVLVLTDSIIFQSKSVPPYLYLFGVLFWLVMGLSGIFYTSALLQRRIWLIFTIFSFLPFSFLCYKQYNIESEENYTAIISKQNKTVQIGDSKSLTDLVFPYSEFTNYIVKTSSESKDNGTSYTDKIFLRHKSGLEIPLGLVSVRSYKNEPFSRYSSLSKEFRRYFNFLPLPVKSELGEPFKELLVSNPSDQKLHSPKEENKNNSQSKQPMNFPIEWKHKVTTLPWFFLFGISLIGHLGVILFYSRLKYNQTLIWPILFILLGYIGSIFIFYDFIFTKQGLNHSITESSSGFVFQSRQGSGKNKLERMIPIQGWEERIIFLELPTKYLSIQSKVAYQKSLELGKKLSLGKISISESLRLTKEIYNASASERIDLSDLPMEVAVRFFLVLPHSWD
ncbi:hypothetical protein P3G55_08445 [Leptospira sp. 96542]|nr:hypothetical protein [Leptospira sp. 96542]